MNPFAVLEVPESALLDSELLKERFHALSRRHHPDVALDEKREESSRRFAAINRAYQLLQSPATRLRELLRLRGKQDLADRGSIPAALLELFMDIGPVFQEADALIDDKSRAGTALAKALLAPKLMSVQERLGEIMASLRKAADDALAELPEIDALLAQPQPNAPSLDAAGALCRRLLYLEKWQVQSQAKWHQLAL